MRSLPKSGVLHLSVLPLVLVSVLSCGPLAQLPGLDSAQVTTKIQSIRQHPLKTTVTIRIRGRILRQVPLVGSQAYELEDETGRIWVVTKQVLTTGNVTTVQGVVRYHPISIAGQNLGEAYLESQDADQGASPAST
jgi:hypothetical protein